MILNERRRPGFAGDMLRRVLLIWVLVALLEVATNALAIRDLRFPDPDDTLRLVQVRDWLAGQGWFDVHQYRIDPPGGVAMHWSRLVDVPIAAVIIAFAWLLGQPGAELVALIVVPLVTLGCVMLLVGRIAWKLFDEEVAGLACLACGLAVPLVHQLRPMRIDHHGWQIVAALAAVNGLMARDPRRGGWIAGAALAVGLNISIEGLPFAAAVIAVSALRWLRNRAERGWMVHTMHALAASSIGLFLLTRGLGDLSQHCDAISPVHLAILAWGALVVSLVAAFEPCPRAFLLVGMAAAVGGAMLILWQAAPVCVGGPFAALDPLVRTFWYDRVLEGLPLWRDSIAALIQGLGLPLLALGATWQLATGSSGWLRRWWIEYALLLLAASLIGLLVARAAGFACALAAVPLGWQLREWLRATRTAAGTRGRGMAVAGILLAVAPVAPLGLLVTATPGEAALVRDKSVRVSTCKIDAAAPGIAALPKGDILAPLDIGPRLIYLTPHTVVATGHHRAAKAMHEVIAGFLGPSAAAYALIRRRGIEYVALCPDLGEPQNYVANAPHGFAAELIEGRAPGWLRPVPLPGDGSFRLWRVVG